MKPRVAFLVAGYDTRSRWQQPSMGRWRSHPSIQQNSIVMSNQLYDTHVGWEKPTGAWRRQFTEVRRRGPFSMVRGAEGPRWPSHVDGGRRTAWWALEVETFGRMWLLDVFSFWFCLLFSFIFPFCCLVAMFFFFVERKGRILVGVVAMDALRGRGQGPALSGLELQTFGGWRVCVFYLIFFCHFFLVFFWGGGMEDFLGAAVMLVFLFLSLLSLLLLFLLLILQLLLLVFFISVNNNVVFSSNCRCCYCFLMLLFSLLLLYLQV